MRYEDMPDDLIGFDPLMENVTTENLYVIGVHAPDSKVYLKLNESNRVTLNTDDTGKFEYTFDVLKVDDSISFQMKNGNKFEEFWNEKIRG